MAEVLYGAPVAEGIKTRTLEMVSKLRHTPQLAIVRTGREGDDLAYEKSIRAACAACGVTVWTAELPGYLPQETLVRAVHKVGRDRQVHGVIVMCPRQYDAGLLAAAVGRKKDVDGLGFAEGGDFAPCTAAAVMEMLDYYKIDCAGKNTVVVGRGRAAGAPIAVLLHRRGALVSLCHSQTPEPEKLCKSADILVAAAGRAGLVDKHRLSQGQTVIDVGINVLPDGGIRGDVDASAAEICAAVTPVPGGVGAVTPYVLALHTAMAAEKLENL